jgi:hypothetical protein
MKDYFYYAQIHTQGEDTTAPRKIEGTVELTVRAAYKEKNRK